MTKRWLTFFYFSFVQDLVVAVPDVFDAYKEMFLHFTHFIVVLSSKVNLMQATLS